VLVIQSDLRYFQLTFFCVFDGDVSIKYGITDEMFLSHFLHSHRHARNYLIEPVCCVYVLLFLYLS
jgi:hypothetical protein